MNRVRSREPLVTIDDLVTTFTTPMGDLTAVDHVSLQLHESETLGVVGESGSGKSVLARSIMGLLNGRAVSTTGSVRFEGRDVLAMSPRERRALWGVEIAMVFQDPMTSLNPVVTVGRQITEVLRLRLGMHRAKARERAVELLRSVGIPEPEQRLQDYPHRMSGGMRQRVVIAIALAGEPRLLLADEPTTALDVTVGAQILDLVQTQQADRAMAMVLVSHDLAVVNGRTDRTAVMYAGQVVELAPTGELFASMRMPYTEALVGSIPTMERERSDRLATIPGRPPDLTTSIVGCRFASRCSYVQARCRQKAPPLIDDGDDHWYRCWYPLAADQARGRLSWVSQTSHKESSGG